MKKIQKSVSQTVSNPMVVIEERSRDVAIIGIAASMPKSPDLDSFWQNLTTGRNFVSYIPISRKNSIEEHWNGREERNTVAYEQAAYLDNIDCFDYAFFGISHQEACTMNPSHRLFLQTAWNAVEDAGYAGEGLKGSRTGSFICFSDDSVYHNLIEETQDEKVPEILRKNMRPMAASRFAQILDLKGPCIAVDSTCASSAVAIALACDSIRNGTCQTAIVGGTQLSLYPFLQVDGVHAPDGKTRSFDKDANGAGSGEGSIVFVLKSKDHALADGDHIHALIKGYAINHDGKTAGLTIPGVLGQEDCIVRAWRDAQIDPASITYWEAHGSATKFGDQIEMESITRAFRRYTKDTQFCALGCVKTNIGHLIGMSGMAGMLKAVLSLKNRYLTPLLHFHATTETVELEGSPLYILREGESWQHKQERYRCGVSSFSNCGTNCHLVLEEAPPRAAGKRAPGLFVLSAAAESSLIESAHSYIRFLNTHSELSLEDICYTVASGRKHQDFRLAIIASDLQELREKLEHMIQAVKSNTEIKDDQIFVGKWYAKGVQPNVGTDFTEDRGPIQETRQMAVSFLNGQTAGLNRMYAGNKGRKVSLPGTCFAKTVCRMPVRQ